MSTLDKLRAKLEAIQLDPISEFDGLQLSSSDIDQIVKAFIEEGWHTKLVSNPEPGVYVSCMTGAEWFAKFEKEINEIQDSIGRLKTGEGE